MRFNVSKLSEIFIYISIMYLIFFPFDTSFITFLIVIVSILISYDIVLSSNTNYFGMYRSINSLDFFWINTRNNLKNTIIPYFIFSFFVVSVFYINTTLYLASLVVITIVLIYLVINLVISTLNCFLVEVSKIITFVLLFLAVNFLMSYLGNPDLEIFLKSLSIYSWIEENYLIQYIKLFIVLLIYLVLIVITRKRHYRS